MRSPAAAVTRIIVGVDGSASAANAVHWAAAEACRRQVVLRIVSAWQDLGQPRQPVPGDPASIAAARVQDALMHVLGRPHYPRRIACCTPQGMPGQALLEDARETGLLVLGLTAVNSVPVPGTVNQYCRQHGRGPLVFVPAIPC